MEKGPQRSLARVWSRSESLSIGQDNQEQVENDHSDLNKKNCGTRKGTLWGNETENNFYYITH